MLCVPSLLDGKKTRGNGKSWSKALRCRSGARRLSGAAAELLARVRGLESEVQVSVTAIIAAVEIPRPV